VQQIQNEIAQVFAAHLALIGTDIEAWSDLLAEDAIVEFPYAAALGMPDRFEGKPAGKIIHYREYWNPIAMLNETSTETFRQAANAAL
jgi:ketosteroid isomerase-like protein